ACPAETDVARYVALVADGRYEDAYAVNLADNVFPACVGHICARPCEDACRRKYVDAPVGIRAVKRVAAERRREKAGSLRITPAAPNGRTIAVVGAGVAGLSAARELALRGYRVTVYDRYPVPGGMLWAGVPAWRLPRDAILDEVQAVTDLGVDIRYGIDVGRDILLSQLAAEHDALVIATGCPTTLSLGLPGEELDGVVSGLHFLEQANLAPETIDLRDQRVVTIGGGFTSIDCVRSALRLGATQATLAYRRSLHEIPVDLDELEEAEREGVEFQFLVTPVRILEQSGRVSGVEFVRNRLEQPDESGRCAVTPLPGSGFVLPCDRVIVAIGQRASVDVDPEGLITDRQRRIAMDPTDEMRTVHPKIWMAGDVSAGPRNFISAIADGKRVAVSIDAALEGAESATLDAEIIPLPVEGSRTALRHRFDDIATWSLTTPSRRLRWGDDYLSTPRETIPLRPIAERGLDGSSPAQEVELGLSEKAALTAASRCLQCQLNIFIDPDSCILCNACVEVCPQQCIEMIVPDRLAAIDDDAALAQAWTRDLAKRGAAMVIDEEACIRCGRCVDRCPTGSLTMAHFRPLAIAE
ncbi:MAG TPA: FAD-dependent oxidoreductase, partial [Nitrolancea sp.]|nr:FAD-dependent oxidoreductase [Nitrolancea sp.]